MERVAELGRRTDVLWVDDLQPALEKEGVRLVDWAELDVHDRAHLGELFRERDLPRADPALGRSGAPVPVHLVPVAQPRRSRSRPIQRRAALRTSEGAAAAPSVHRDARRRAVRPYRAGHRSAPGGPVPGHGDRRSFGLPPDPRRGLRSGGGGGRGSPRGDRVRPAAPTSRRHPGSARARRVVQRRGTDAVDARARAPARRGVRRGGAPRPLRAVVPLRARASGAQGRPVDPRDPASPGRGRGLLRGHLERRPPRPPPVRLVRDLRRGVHRAGGAGPRRPRDQARHLPNVRGEPDRPRPGARRRSGQAGRRARRAPGTLRRARQHHAGSHAGTGRRPRRLRHRGAEDARQGVPGRSPRGVRHPALRPRRHRQLQPEHRPPVRGCRPADRGSGARCRSQRPVQPPHRLQPAADVPPPAGRPHGSQAEVDRI